MKLLERLNSEYAKLHTGFELLFWEVYMTSPEKGEKMNTAAAKRDAFRASKKLAVEVDEALQKAKGEEKSRLLHWKHFFSLFQTPEQVLPLKRKATDIESKIATIRQTRKEGYTDPYTNTFVEASENKMRGLVRTNPDEKIRKAAYAGLQKLPLDTLDLYVELVKVRNEFARGMGYDNFYAYKLDLDEQMTLDELFSIFNKLYEKTKYALDDIKALEKQTRGITKPWNFSYMIAGDFVTEEDKYFPLDKALLRWGQSFSALGVGLEGGRLVLDLLDRKGKHNNGFCHYPRIVEFKNGKRVPAEARVSCTAVIGEIGSGYNDGHNTLFHEGGHAADRLNSYQKDTILNTEYPPSSVSWAETHSMFMDSMLGGIDWKTRYADYPFELFERKIRKTGFLAPLHIFSINAVMELERRIYESKNLTDDEVIKIAQQTYRKFWGLDDDSLNLLNVSHIYSWESSGYYHGYGLAELQVCQWREYFYKKYGYIVDNPNVGKELKKVWKLGSSQPSKEFIKIATGKKLSPDAYIRSVTGTPEQKIKTAKQRIARLEKVKRYTKPVNLNGTVIMMHGKKKIADSTKGFEKMAEKYKKWLNTLK